MSPSRRFAAFVFQFLLVLAPVGTAFGQAFVELVTPTKAIPDVPYKTWSLFLVCTPDWVMPDRSSELANLYHRFKVFGDAIGSDNLAVWFWKEEMPIVDPELSDNVDVARSTEYCRALELEPSKGPYLVVTSAYPSLPIFPPDRAVFSLGALQPLELAELLNSLTDELLLKDEIDASVLMATSSQSRPATGFWVRLLETAQRSMVGFGCRLKLEIHTGLVSAELRECLP